VSERERETMTRSEKRTRETLQNKLLPLLMYLYLDNVRSENIDEIDLLELTSVFSININNVGFLEKKN
jgi:hypothetical protein